MQAEIGGMRLQAGEPRGRLAAPAASERGRDGVSPRPPTGARLCSHRLHAPGPQDREGVRLRVVSGLGCGPSRGRARTRMRTDRSEDTAISTWGPPAPCSAWARQDWEGGSGSSCRLTGTSARRPRPPPPVQPCTGTPTPHPASAPPDSSTSRPCRKCSPLQGALVTRSGRVPPVSHAWPGARLRRRPHSPVAHLG